MITPKKHRPFSTGFPRKKSIVHHFQKWAPILIVLFLHCSGSAAFAETGRVHVDWVGQISRGGAIIWIQIALSVVGLAVILERMARLRRSRIAPKRLLQKADALWTDKKYDDVAALGTASKSLLGSVIAFVATHRDLGYAELNAASGDIASSGIRKHQLAAYPLAVVATLEPLLGLLGTVIGMIEAFQIVAQAGGAGDPLLLADSIARALLKTALGLAIAIPALGFYHLFRIRAGSLGFQLEKEVNALLVAWVKKPVSK